VAEVRVLFRKGQLGTSGSVSWDFDHLGIIEAEPANAGADAELAAIEAGAQDFEAGDENLSLFYTEPTDLDAVCKALPEFGFTVQSANLGYKAKEVEAFLEALDNHDDVQNVYVGLQAG
jgi:transcriptional/translational regulatory protein YebC/TACO1